MIKKNLTVLLIEDNPDFAELVQRWLALRSDLGFNLSWADSLAAGLERLGQGGVDVILLDLGLPDSEGLPTFTRTRLHAAGLPIVLLSGDDSEPLALQMMQDGAQDYIAKSACNGDLLSRAIQYAVARYGGRADKLAADAILNLTRVIGVLGAKGGTGTTTVACHLAVELQRQTDQKTLLMDLDTDGGMVRFLMNIESEYSVLDAVQNAQHLDASFWSGIVTEGPGKLHMVPSPQLAGRAGPDSDSLARALTPIRDLYRWIVLDLGRLTCRSRGLLGLLSELFLVSTTSVPALFEARRTMGALREAGFEGDRLRVLINRDSKNELSGSELDRVFGAAVYARIPEAGRELNEACVRRKLCAESSDFGIEMARLARKMAGLPMDKPKSRVSQIFSFAEKTKASEAGTSAMPSAR